MHPILVSLPLSSLSFPILHSSQGSPIKSTMCPQILVSGTAIPRIQARQEVWIFGKEIYVLPREMKCLLSHPLLLWFFKTTFLIVLLIQQWAQKKAALNMGHWRPVTSGGLWCFYFYPTASKGKQYAWAQKARKGTKKTWTNEQSKKEYSKLLKLLDVPT